MAKKLYYKIGEACKLLGIQPYVLRFWETEFPFLKPTKSKSGQRVYQEPQLNLIRRIKELLYEEEYTIAGAKKKLEAEIASGQLVVIGEDGAENKTQTTKKKNTATAKKKASASTAKAAESSTDGTINARPNSNEQAKKLAKLREGIQEAADQCQKILRLLEA